MAGERARAQPAQALVRVRGASCGPDAVLCYTSIENQTPRQIGAYFGVNARELLKANKRDYPTLALSSRMKAQSTIFFPEPPTKGLTSIGYINPDAGPRSNAADEGEGQWAFGVDLNVRLYQGEYGGKTLVPRCCGSACLRSCRRGGAGGGAKGCGVSGPDVSWDTILGWRR
eukprot:3939564-Rhodomonas_salina.1